MTDIKFPKGTKVRMIMEGSLFQNSIGTVVGILVPQLYDGKKYHVAIESFGRTEQEARIITQIMAKPVEKRLYYFTEAELEAIND